MRRAKFSLSNYKLLSCDMGELVPCGLTEVLPGDTIQQATSALIRCSPLLAPVMHPVDVRIHHWFVPNRLVWDNWEDFITGGPDGMNASVFPTITSPDASPAVGTLGDYYGIPPGLAAGRPVSALPFRGYALIWNEWYRDQDLQSEIGMVKTDGPDTSTNRTLQNVAWEKDYFTSARPWEQKGPAISIPLTGNAPVVTTGAAVSFRKQATPAEVKVFEAQGTAQVNRPASAWSAGNDALAFQATGLQANLTGISAVTMNQLREAMALQRYEEARARFGSRYTEYLRYLGVRSSDARLQRPEYLGGGRQKIQFSEVLATAASTAPAINVGDLKGHGLAAMRSNRYRKFFEEHGYIHSFLSVKPKTMYSQGIFRTWNRRTKEDYYQKELEHIGQQEVYNKEVYAPHTTPDGIFGYQDRYDEYRRTESTVSGEFRTVLNFWHMAREFSSDPALNATFVKSVPTERTFAVPANDVLWIMANHNIQARRLLSPIGNSFIY